VFIHHNRQQQQLSNSQQKNLQGVESITNDVPSPAKACAFVRTSPMPDDDSEFEMSLLPLEKLPADERRAEAIIRELGLSHSARELTNMSIQSFNRVLIEANLQEGEISLIKGIRRRGKRLHSY